MAWALDYPENEHDTRLMMGDPVAQSYEWIKRYALSLGTGNCYEHCGSCDECAQITAEELIEYGSAWVEDKRDDEGWRIADYLCKGGALEGTSTDPMFWDKLAILKGIEIPANKRENFFTCSC